MKYKKWLIGAFLLVMLCLGGWLWWRTPSAAPARKSVVSKLMPEVKVGSMNVSDIDPNHIKMTAKVSIKNTLPFELRTHNLSYEIFIDSVKVLQDAYKKPISIRSHDSTTIELPMELLAPQMAKILRYFDQRKIDSADYTVKTHFTVEVPVTGDREFSPDFSKRMPALHLPNIRVTDVDMNVLKLKKKGVDIQVLAENPNLFPIKMKEGTFRFTVENDMELDGVLEKIIVIPAHGSQAISLHADLKKGKVLKMGWKMLTAKDDTHFTYAFQCGLLSDNGMLNNSKIAMTVNGTLNELLQSVKNMKKQESAKRDR